ncbi:myosin-binding protein 7 [Phoenix dactylifera]|uniref:Myosin-binding protein 7 n=1 Tax=Phoenix dactylifera TaxID=42345 RepID=A0A8B7C1Y8_PHODC|nr:myosin-binding protein 7 [Phoenix dactylifera]
MDPEEPPPAAAQPPQCDCSCLCCGPTAAWRRSLKRKLDQVEAGVAVATMNARRDRPIAGEGEGDEEVARVEIENEAAALREALGSHQQSIQELYTELEEERNAAATAASEAMSMILRLQREKAEAQMEARQFKRFAEEKMAHEQQEFAALEDLLFKRDQAVQSLSCEVQAYKHCLLSYGIIASSAAPTPTEPLTPDAATATASADVLYSQFDLPPPPPLPSSLYDYPPLRCTVPSEADNYGAATDLEKYPFGETPREHLQKLEQRICQLERMPSSSHFVMDKGVIGQSPRGRGGYRPKHLRKFSSFDSFGPGSPTFNRGEEFPVMVDRAWDCSGRDDMSDRVYTVDAVNGVMVGACESYMSTPREFWSQRDPGSVEEGEIRKLYMRLQALEADRESMRQAIISMGTDKAQTVLLKEIAQQLCKDAVPERRIIKKQSFLKRFSIMSAIKRVMSFLFWRKKSSRIKYTFGLSASNAGLLLLLDKTSRMRHRRFLTRTQW